MKPITLIISETLASSRTLDIWVIKPYEILTGVRVRDLVISKDVRRDKVFDQWYEDSVMETLSATNALVGGV